MVAGEYAVLDGAPAIVLAVDRGVQCTISVGDALRISTPSGDDRFVRPALTGHIGTYDFREWNPTGLAEKPGFGGSAAACVASCLAAGRPATDAIAIHREVQGGGSGADVLASIHGGMLRVENHTAVAMSPLCPVVVWSGASAKTQPRIDQYLAATDRDDFVAASTEIVSNFDLDPIRMLGENADLLMHMSVETGVPYMTPALASIRRLAREYGGEAKPSGAGGGDCAIALFPDEESEQGFLQALSQRERITIPINVAGPARLLG